MNQIMQKAQAEVGVVGELVVMQLAGLRFAFEFDLALKMAVALRVEARYAKMSVHDTSRRIRVHGRIHNATPDRVAPSRWRAKIPAALKGRDVSIAQKGSTVEWRVGPHTMTMPYEYCFTVAQWLTINGRAARDAAGEKGDWEELANAKAAVARERNLN